MKDKHGYAIVLIHNGSISFVIFHQTSALALVIFAIKSGSNFTRLILRYLKGTDEIEYAFTQYTILQKVAKIQKM